MQKTKELNITAYQNLIFHTSMLNQYGLGNNGILTKMIYEKGVVLQRFQ